MAYEQEHPLINGASNNTTATQDSLGGGWMSASLSSSADVDYFKVTTTSAALLKIELNNSLLTATNYWTLALLDSNGDYVSRLISTVSGTPTVDGTNSGTTLAVTGLTSAVPVGSRFTFATSSADTTIYTVTSATALSSGNSTLTLDQSLPGSLAASTALVFDPAQSSAAGGLTTLTGQVSAAGTYFVKVSAASWSDAEYSVRATVLPTIESTGDNDSKAAAIPSLTTDQNRPLENARMTGNLSGANDADFWVFSTATMSGDINIDFAAASGDNNAPEWDIKLTQWTGDQPLTTVQGVAISATAGASKTFTIEAAKYSTANTYVIEVLKPSGVTVDTGPYTLRVRGDALDMNDTPIITIDSVTSTRPYDVVATGVSRSVKAGTDSKVALSTLFSASDADAGQTVASYQVALSKASGELGSVAGSIALIESNGTTSATYAMNSTVTLTAAEMAKAYLLPGTVTGNLSLALQAFDSSGALDNSGASSVMVQTLRVVSSAVGVTATNDGTLSLVEGNGSSESLSFVLGAAPTQDVKVYLEQDSNNRFSFDKSVLTFTSSNYGSAQTVIATARDNQITEGSHSGQISFRVVSLDSQYDGYSITPLTVAIADPANNLPSGSVTISGTVTQGQTLTAANTLADADGLGSIGYQWKADGNAISGATGNTLVLAEAQVGKIITVSASYTDQLGHSESVASSATVAVVNVNDAPTGSVTISGTATRGQTLTAANTLADADGLGTVTYQWSAAGAAISGATASTYVLTQAEAGKTVTVTANYTDGHNTTESVTSSATAAVTSFNVAPTGSVTISGAATQGQTLTAANTLADADGLGAVTYQWSAGGTAISGATASAYVLTQAEVGKTVTVTANYTDGHSTAESVASSATAVVANVNDAPTGSVTISGTATQGQTLTAANTLADADGLGAVTYQWSANGTAISGATASTYLLTQAEVGKTITVTASYTDLLGHAESLASSATATVAAVSSEPTPTPTPTPTPITVDGASGSVSTSTTDGQTTTTQTFDPISSTRVDSGGSTNSTLADIPLATDSAGLTLVQVSLPVGVGVTSSSTATASGGTTQTLRQQLVSASTPHVSNADQLSEIINSGIDQFVPGVTDSSQVTVRTITLTVAPGTIAAPSSPIHISGSTGAGEGDTSHPLRQEALVIDASKLPSGTVLDLNNVEFAIIIGPATATGGLGRNYVIGDGSAQTIILGQDDDILHGGAGDDVVGSKGGNDQLFGDEGNDTVVGGLGDDQLDGGAGNDLLVGGQSDAGQWSFKQAAGEVAMSWTPSSAELADSRGSSSSANRDGGTAADPRLAFAYQSTEMRETVTALYQLLLHQLPTVEEMNFWCNAGYSVAELDYGASNLLLKYVLDLPVQFKVKAILSQIWGADKVTADLLQIGTDYINAGGNYGRVVEVLVKHENFRNGLLNADGSMTLTQNWSLADSGWASDIGKDTLLGGTGNDTLVGGHGNDVLDGGSGTDIAVWFATAANFEVQIVGSGASKDVALLDTSSGELDIIRNIEQLQIGGVNFDATKLESLTNVEAYLSSHADHHLQAVLVGLTV